MRYSYAGIDGCRDGWFCVQLGHNTEWAISILQVDVIGSITRSSKVVLIDIPIGLLDSGTEERTCDREARRLLGPKRGPSVFPAPARGTLGAKDYSEAVEINRRLSGRGISKQSWAISPKIRAIDELLQTQQTLRGVLRECHPELCFWALNGGKAMAHNKKTAAGRLERLSILRRFFPPAELLYEKAKAEYLRRQVALDDIIDAMVAAVTAKHGDDELETLPAQPPRDITGLSMEMVYYTP